VTRLGLLVRRPYGQATVTVTESRGHWLAAEPGPAPTVTVTVTVAAAATVTVTVTVTADRGS
jgi:hypothetical protein